METPASPAPGLSTAQPASVAASSQPVVETIGLTKRFGAHTVLDNVNLKVYRGETVVVMGGSGTGKSVLLRCLIGAHRPDEGTVKLFGRDIWAQTPDEMNGLRKRFGILFQSGALYSSMTVGENVALPLREHTDLPPEMIDLIVKVKLELVGLREAEDLLPSEISGGMLKRAGLARAIALDPELLFYDEPTSGLDPPMTGTIDGIVIDLAEAMKITSIVVSHDLKSAERISDRVVMLHEGRIVAEGTWDQVQRSTNPFVLNFLQGPVESKTAVYPRVRR